MNLRDVFEEHHRRYALSTVSATLKTYHHWLRQGYSEEHSLKNAIKYGVAQIQSIVTPDSTQDSLQDFEMLSTISQRLANVLREKLEATGIEKRIVESQI